MEKHISIERTLEQTENNRIKKIKQSPLKGIILLVVALLIIFIYNEFFYNSDSILSPILILLFVLFLIWGGISTFIRKTLYLDEYSKSKLCFVDLFYDKHDREKLLEIIEKGNYDAIKSVKKSRRDGILLRIAFSYDKSLCYVQVLTLLPFGYALKTMAKKLSIEQVNDLFKILF